MWTSSRTVPGVDFANRAGTAYPPVTSRRVTSSRPHGRGYAARLVVWGMPDLHTWLLVLQLTMWSGHWLADVQSAVLFRTQTLLWHLSVFWTAAWRSGLERLLNSHKVIWIDTLFQIIWILTLHTYSPLLTTAEWLFYPSAKHWLNYMPCTLTNITL